MVQMSDACAHVVPRAEPAGVGARCTSERAQLPTGPSGLREASAWAASLMTTQGRYTRSLRSTGRPAKCAATRPSSLVAGPPGRD